MSACACIEWKDYYSVGVPSLDDQHKQIIGIFNELYQSVEKDTDHKIVKALLDRLAQYTFNHFKCEEQALQEHNYPEYLQHKVLHDKLRKKTLDLLEHDDLVTGHDLLRFLKEWWLEHIHGDDKKYTPYLQEPVAQE